MRYSILIFGLICFMRVYRSNAANKCFNAKTCVHDGKEKCGADRSGKIRRFLDTCDMKEYNCLKETDYERIPLERCQDLPLIGEVATKLNEKEFKGDQDVVDEDKAQEDVAHVQENKAKVQEDQANAQEDEIKVQEDESDAQEDQTKAQEEIKDKEE